MIFGILLFSTLFCSCIKQKEPVVDQSPPLAVDMALVRIDTLMQHNADSALAMLLSFRAEQGTISDINTHYQTLLTSEALYKTYNPRYDIASLQSATHYFDSLLACHPNNDELIMFSARSHYMNGAISYENDSIVKACREYIQTLEIMQNHFEPTDLVGYRAKFMTLTYNRLVDLFSNQFMMEPAIYCGKKAIYFCNIEPTSKYGLANTIFHVGKNHDILGNTDSAYFYYNKAIECLPDSNNYVYRDISSHKALLSYDLTCDAEKSLYELKKTLAQTNNEEEKLSRYNSIGYIYFNEGNYDSACLYLKYIFYNTSDGVLKLKTAEYLQNIYQSIDDYDEADKYSRFLATFAVSKYTNMMEISALDKLFNDYLERQIHNRHYQNKKRSLYTIIAISAILALIISVSIHIKNRKIKDTSLKYDKEKIKVSDLEQKLVQKRSETELRIECFLKENVCRKIIDIICDIPASARSNYSDYTYLKLDEETIVELGEAVTKHFPNMKTRLISNDIKLKKDDLLLCYLYLLGLNNSQIALLRQCNFATICRQAKRLKETFIGCKDLPGFIKKIAID